jgi:hypothetical protein
MVIDQEAKGRAAYGHLTFRRSIREALQQEYARPVVFVDDNISSATQARAQFLTWAGVPREKWPDECKDEDNIINEALSESHLEQLRKRPIHVVTCVGRPPAEENLRIILEEHGFEAFHGVCWKHKAEDVVTWSAALRKFLCAVGVSLIAWCRYRKDPSELDEDELKFCRERAFGYGNVGSLVATASNVPTATVTGVWSPGMYRRSPWMPLLIRRNKLRHLVLG